MINYVTHVEWLGSSYGVFLDCCFRGKLTIQRLVYRSLCNEIEHA